MADTRTNNKLHHTPAHDVLITPWLDLDALIAWVDGELDLIDRELSEEATVAVAA